MSIKDLNSLPGVTAHPEAVTRDYVFNHTMLRVKDIERSLDFYTRVLGFSMVEKHDFPKAGFSLYFLALLADPGVMPDDPAERHEWRKAQAGMLELTHNHGTENDPAFHYHDGNGEPRGFGHLCITVPDIRAAQARFESLQVPFKKRLEDGSMRDIAFIKDPDGYWVEVIQLTPLQA
ncbi:lactoylglutathione lyase [Kerstersia gyiorum]|jgi:lactoylglutathione lyase|uniref:lactoylglutathione lyase n=1 Tax=Kerstersia gyiorum TaxID=206506 RepID=A0A4Q7MQ96_9BURK|nr:lactoylglutathione lyase [Kerstersia gyiorum]MCO7640167.1 lactoylglutathione lyase [Pseudomonas sp. S 311-6]KAB0543252.1 lactoylglutathione lyase [Kerstersia gyiorum]MCI1227757.1 lactoylglutathione lyase [Kerstersia gyiorum]MCP1632704.1 lactoylglutathione lyase [Kerstersia gyiorum]MCP1635765.1 lactoylglutathione lyase [Kerstersia gyiorum]